MVLDESTIRREYIELQRTYQQIAETLNVSKGTVITAARAYGIKSRPGGRKPAVIEIGKHYDGLTVKYRRDEKTKHPQYVCICDCGKETIRTSTDILSGKKKTCWDCRGEIISRTKWQGHGEISKDVWSSIKRSAKKRNLLFEVSIENAWQLFLDQDRKCALTGLAITFSRNRKFPYTASLDRISSSLGYIPLNVQWLHRDVNTMKWDLDSTYFLDMCRLIASNNP